MKFSKDLLELRDKEAKLVKMKRYEEAEKVKMKADLLEEFERNKLEAEVCSIVDVNVCFRCKLLSRKKKRNLDISNSWL